jgi:hypothetical protein
MSRVFIDVNIAMYAGGTAHPLREPSQRIVMAVATDRLDAVTDAEVFQELLYRYLHLRQREKGFLIFDAFYGIMHGRVLSIADTDIQRARTLAEQYPNLSPRDLLHLSVMLDHGITEILTADTDFDTVQEVRRLDLIQFAATIP